MAESSVDAIVTDPPYGLAFMGKNWDHGVPGAPFWEAALRVAKPGCHLLAFGGTRTFHRLACATEDAGWELRDTIMWVYGSGFPKSLDVSKAIDNEKSREVGYHEVVGKNPVTDAAKQWQGWGTALKPAWEPIIVARKPLVGTVAENVQAWGTGALNIDGCRVGTETTIRPNGATVLGVMNDDAWKPVSGVGGSVSGRWPANLIHDGSDEVVGLFPQAARFFYCAKASRAERELGLDGLEERVAKRYGEQGQGPSPQQTPRVHKPAKNHHPTVKPLALMRYLCSLVTPPGGLVLDPFAGSGTTGVAALQEGFRFVGIEKEAEYVAIAEARMAAVGKQPQLF